MDLEYWEKYYQDNKLPFEPSDFSKYVVSKINKNSRLIDLGCGNGRDSLFFADNKILTVGIDQSKEAIKALQKFENKFLKFENSNFSNLEDSYYDFAYCRFVFHSINEIEENNLLRWMKTNIKSRIFIESRIDLDEKKYIETNHYRRLMNTEKFLIKVKTYGFSVDYFEVSDEFSKYKKNYNVKDINFDPKLARITLNT